VEQIGGLWDRQGQRCIVFDVDATRQAAGPRALPCTPEVPPARRRLDAVCGPGYKGRKRGEVVRTQTTALQMHTRQWIGTYGGRGNGDYRGELASALQAIIAYLAHFEFPPEVALVRLDGQYGDAAVIAQIIEAGVFLVTRGRGYQLLEHPQIQRVLAHPPTTSVTSTNTGEVVELFEGGWVSMGEGLPRARVMVARHPAPAPDKPVTVGKRIDEWVYELFITTLGAERFLAEDVLDLSHGRGAFEAVLAGVVCRRRSGPVVFSRRVWARTVATGLPLGVEPATGPGTHAAARETTRDRVGATQRDGHRFLGGRSLT
jgi:hypothetical protein